MAISFIPVDAQKTLGAQLLSLAREARMFTEQLTALKAIADGMVDATDYTVFEAQFGVPTGKGGDLVYMLAALKTGIDGITQMTLLPNWLGQVG